RTGCANCLRRSACTVSARPGRPSAPWRAGISGAVWSWWTPRARQPGSDRAAVMRERAEPPRRLVRVARSDSAAAFELFAVCAPGLETLVAAELRALGALPGAVEPGGVAFSGAEQTMFRANLHSRIASRVMARVGRFRARHDAARDAG